ncbi:MAG: SNF2 helicase associated domain-containing protein [Deltaproteobacteria bacterium]|nr:SNF2 helicase associated domain-containing protein [Deltaproteobacteria bacterium]
MTPTPGPWHDSLTVASLQALLGPERLTRALDQPLEYLNPPGRGPGESLQAKIRSARHLPWLPRREESLTVVVATQDTFRGSRQIVGRCSCQAWQVCPHIISFGLDLALTPELRAAAWEDRAGPQHLELLRERRERFLDEARVDLVGRSWWNLPEPSLPQPLKIHLRVLDGGRTGRADNVQPGLELRLYRPGERAAVAPPEVTALPHQFTVADQALVMLAAVRPGKASKHLVLSGLHATVALDYLSAGDRELYFDEKPAPKVHFSTVPLRLRIAREVLPSEALAGLGREAYHPAAGPPRPALRGWWHSPDGAIECPANEAVLFHGPRSWVWVPSLHVFHPMDPSVDGDVAWAVHRAPAVALPSGGEASVFRLLRPRARLRGVGLPPPDVMGLPPQERPRFTVKVTGSPLELQASLEAAYPSGVFELTLSEEPSEPFRDAEAEACALAWLDASGLRVNGESGLREARDDAAVAFWREGVTRLRGASPETLTVLLEDKLKRVSVRPPLKASARVRLVDDLLATEVEFTSDEVRADLAALRRALANKRRWVELDDGSLAEVTGQVEALVAEADEVLSPAGTASLAVHQLGRIERWVDAGVCELDDATRALRERFRACTVKGEPQEPAGLKATLRPYQRQGLAWLQFLAELGLGGILADDMGLGKTVTALALVLWRRHRDGAKPSLVVCPTSVAGNWVRESQRFTPALGVLNLSGLSPEERASALGAIGGRDLVVTTYALLRRDAEALKGVGFRYVLLDEAQSIKNAVANTTQAARSLQTEARLALTGTPVENRLQELWSILDWTNPGILGGPTAFGSRYERPIVLAPSGPEAQRLRALVRPFVLRRTKREVLKELPPKEEIDLVLPLGAGQRRRYDAVAHLAREEVSRAIGEAGLSRSKLTVLTALLRLRQVACDPRLVDPLAPSGLSAKRDEFLSLVRELVAEGRRALVFSQFVELLTLWRAHLDGEGIAYEYLDGSTRDRDRVVERFQTGSAPLFLISLKAGGTGLNLTAADTVIHCDPWWNPAVEDQATDRAHRIGQSQAVTVYRLIAKGTVEERIMTLKARKRELADAVITADAGALQGMSAEDVALLLADVHDAPATEDEDAEPPGATPTAPIKRRRGRPPLRR